MLTFTFEMGHKNKDAVLCCQIAHTNGGEAGLRANQSEPYEGNVFY